MGWLNYQGKNSDIDWKQPVLHSRGVILKQLEEVLSSIGTKPINEVVIHHSKQHLTFPCFYLKSMFLSLLHDKVLIEDIQGRTPLFGDIHAGDFNKTAVQNFC